MARLKSSSRESDWKPQHNKTMTTNCTSIIPHCCTWLCSTLFNYICNAIEATISPGRPEIRMRSIFSGDFIVEDFCCIHLFTPNVRPALLNNVLCTVWEYICYCPRVLSLVGEVNETRPLCKLLNCAEAGNIKIPCGQHSNLHINTSEKDCPRITDSRR